MSLRGQSAAGRGTSFAQTVVSFVDNKADQMHEAVVSEMASAMLHASEGGVMDTHFTVVFERPDGYEDVHPQLCAEDHIIDYPDMKWEAADGNLIQRCDELAEALRPIAERGEISAEIINKARALLAKYRQPQEVPELFPGTLEKLRGLGRKE